MAGIKRVVSRTLTTLGLHRLALTLGRKQLRILAYHGLCEDACAGARWVPSYFVARRRFQEQMAFLARRMVPLSLAEGVRRLRAGDLPARAVAVTFDDGYASVLHLAQPVLRTLGIPATVYLSTQYVESGAFFPFHQLRLAAYFGAGEPAECNGRPDSLYLESPIDVCRDAIAAWWPSVASRLTREQVETLRPLRVPELAMLDADLIELGAHTHSHCILSNETRERRRREIEGCVRQVEAWGGRRLSFSFPNGQPGDFDEEDQRILRTLGVPYAVCTSRGANTARTDPYALRRFSVGLHHDRAIFGLELSGIRTRLRSLLRAVRAP